MKEYILKLCTWVLVLSCDQIGVARLGQKLGILTQFRVCYSATELHNYGADSNETFYNERIYNEVVHLGIGFVVRPKLGSYDLVKNECDLKCRCMDWDGGGLSQFH